jgi:hypothetical protein
MNLSPLPIQKFFDNNGRPLDSGKLFTYQSGTSTKVATYKDSAGLSLNTNPIILDFRGECRLWIDPTQTYTLVLAPASDTDPPTNPIWSVDGVTLFNLTRSLIGQLLYPRTAAEIAAGVTPTDYGYPEGVFERYGATGDGVTDDLTALSNAALVGAQGVRIYGTSGKVYKITASVTAGDFFDLDLRGSTLKPAGNFRGITRSPGGIIATVTATVSSGATIGSRSIVVASATSLVVGQWVRFTSADAAYQASAWPFCYAKIVGIVGTTIEIDTPLGVTYSTGGTISMFAYNTALYGSLFRIVDGEFDLSANTFVNSGCALSVAGYEQVEFRTLTVSGLNTTSTASTAVQLVNCIDVKWDGRSIDNKSAGDIWDIQGARSLTMASFNSDGYHFSFDIIRVDDVAMGNLVLRGRRHIEVDDGLAYRSIRGAKFVGCLRVVIGTLIASDFTSGIKLEGNCIGTISSVVLQHCAYESTSDAALNFSGSGTASNQHGWALGSVVVKDTKGSAIHFATPDTGKYSIASFHLENIGAHGIYVEGDVPDIQIGSGTIVNWAQQGAFQGINCVNGGGFHNITFRNTDAAKGCFNGGLVAGRQFSFSGIRKPDGNPDFSGTVNVLEASGSATIPNAASTVNVTHNLIKQPTADQFTLTMNQAVLPTVAPGEIFVQAISASGANFNCRNVQGATGTTIAWRVRVPDTFTM